FATGLVARVWRNHSSILTAAFPSCGCSSLCSSVMKYAFVFLLSLVLLVSGTSAAPVGCEEAPEDVPQAVPLTAAKILDQLTDVVQAPPKITNVIDGPKVCPEGQMLDHQGKCRPILG
uniref:Uncharacterized protein n=1 Tax=Anopheles albimanus TaxID=7167 RepID=A0A182F3T3_ANOAL